MSEQFFVNIFSTIKARDTTQTVLKSAWNEKNYCSNIDLKFNDAWKSHGALENDFFSPKGHTALKISVMQLSTSYFSKQINV